MANGQINRPDLLSDEAAKFGVLIAEQAGIGQDAIEKFKKSAKDLNNIAIAVGKADDEKKLASAQKERLKVEQEIIKTEKLKAQADKEIIRLNALKEKQQKRNNKQTIEERVLQTELNKIKRIQVRETLGVTGAYARLNRERNLAKQNLADLLSAEKQNVSQIKLVRAEYNKLNARVLAVDKATNNYTKNVGNYGSALNNVRQIVSNLGGALGFAGGAFAAVQVFRNAINDIREFEKANATLSGVLQQTKAESKALSDEAIRLGESTVKTAKEVTGLQIAYARLGFSQQDIINLTEATIQGSIALNSELDETAKLAGAVVNTFDDFSSTDAPEILDVLSLATAKSALDFKQLETGIPIVAGAANAAGVPFTKLVALMGKLSDSGIDVSTSSTALRNIFIESASEGLNYEEILQKIKDSQDKLTASNNAFGKRAAVSATVLAANIDATEGLDEALQNAAGTAERMANNELDTLDGAIKLLNSAWQGYILNTDEANNISGTFKDGIKFLADNLKEILDGLIFVTKAFVAYKAATIAANVGTKLYNGLALLMRARSLGAAKGVGTATLSLKGFNNALKANVIGLSIAVIFGLIKAFEVFNKSALEASKEVSKLNKEFLDNQKTVSKSEKELSVLNDRYKELTEDGIKLTKEEQIELNDVVEKIQGIVPDTIIKVDEYGNRLIVNAGKIKEFSDNQEKLNDLLKEERIEETKKSIEDLEKTISRLNETYKEENGELVKKTRNGNNYLAITDLQEKRVRTLRQETEKSLAQQREELLNLQGLLSERQKAEKLEKESIQNAENEAKVRTSLAKQADLDREAQEKKEQQIFELTKFRLEEKIRLYKADADNQDLQSNIRLEALAKQEQAELKLAKLERDNAKRNSESGIERTLAEEQYQSERLQIVESSFKASDNIAKQSADNLIKENKRVLDAQLSALNQIKTFADTDANNEITAVNNNPVLSAEEREKRIAKIKLKYAKIALDGQIKALESLLDGETITADKRADLELKLSQIKRQATELSIDNNEKDTEDFKRSLQSKLSAAQDLTNALGDFALTLFDARISKIDDEISASEDYYDKQISLAEGDDASQKALEEKKQLRTEQLQARQREEQRKQAVLDKAIAIANIGINTAVNISEVAPNPVLIALAAALGAAQVATVLATPIPQYEKGTQGKAHGGGLAEVAERRPEVIIEPNKKPYVISNRSIVDLPKGTEVVPSVEEFKKMNHYSQIRRMKNNSEKVLNVRNNFDDTNIVNELSLTRRALKRQKRPINNIIIKSDNKFKKVGWNGK